MYKTVDKKEWRKNIDACWSVQNELQKCIENSENYKALDGMSQKIVKAATGKEFIIEYLNFWVDERNSFSNASSNFYNTDSFFWNNSHSNNLQKLYNQCNLFSLLDCCKEKYNLNNLKGNYESVNNSKIANNGGPGEV